MIILASDHRGEILKEKIKTHLTKKNIPFQDMGMNADYPVIVEKAAKKISEGDFGVFICGSGVGVNIAANKMANLRSVQGYNEKIARLSREHNNANAICFSEKAKFKRALDAFLTAEFSSEERHIKRVNMLKKG